MKKLKSLLEQERIRLMLAKARPVLAKTWALARKYGAIAYKYGRIGAREAWIILQRLPIASLSFARALASPEYAEDLRALHADQFSTPGLGAARPSAARAEARATSGTTSGPDARPALVKTAELEKAPPDSALLLLSLLQKEGRFIDFMQEDVGSYSDQDVGAAARVVHEGCGKVLREHLHIAPVREETEGSQVRLEPGFNPAEVRPTGQVVGEPPFTGSLVHRGWRATKIQLPQVASSRDLHILAAAEVEL
ncbi:hypothetical protein Thiowin_02788 [Thiorhodovibrio winogradskyi]|uniref:DUF2760 domain-containing protein n=1 Tax=Thiorhodovibrio winogradskyi TaxID=77007 RepID=A0ABZ0SB35_9GAMM|nr:DUF2760 domain-containing protein [Thiorhodovibrio winogradskyi]